MMENRFFINENAFKYVLYGETLEDVDITMETTVESIGNDKLSFKTKSFGDYVELLTGLPQAEHSILVNRDAFLNCLSGEESLEEKFMHHFSGKDAMKKVISFCEEHKISYKADLPESGLAYRSIQKKNAEFSDIILHEEEFFDEGFSPEEPEIFRVSFSGGRLLFSGFEYRKPYAYEGLYEEFFYEISLDRDETRALLDVMEVPFEERFVKDAIVEKFSGEKGVDKLLNLLETENIQYMYYDRIIMTYSTTNY